MQAQDVMTTNVITVRLDTEIKEIAALLLKHRISAVPVIDADQGVLGIVSEGDVIRRAENGTDNRHSWWLQDLFATRNKAEEYIKTHGRKASEVMTQNVITVEKETPLHEIARLLEKHRIKRVPVTDDSKLVGIVSRANILHGLAAQSSENPHPASVDDRTIREQLLDTLSQDAGLDTGMINVIVRDSVVQLWGIVDSDTKKQAALVAAENMPGVKSVENHLSRVPTWYWSN